MKILAEGDRDAKGQWVPKELPAPTAPFRKPFNWRKTVKVFLSTNGLIPAVTIKLALATVVWYFLTPSLEQTATLHAEWILLIYLRNVVLLTIIAGRLHWHLFVRKVQGMKYKYTNEWQTTADKKFMFSSQTWDNVFFSLVSGCGVWTGYEVLFLWGWANDIFPTLELRANLGILIAVMLLMTYYFDTHFYFTHRLFHWKPLYKIAHHVHHRNISFGPWSGLSMHPLEHLIFFSHVLPFLFIPMHPVVVMFMLIARGIGPAGGHSGYHKFLRNKDREEKPMRRLLFWGEGADFFHHLHHRYFTVNFAGNLLPLDKWLHTFHDGSPESHQLMLGRKNSKAKIRTRKTNRP